MKNQQRIDFIKNLFLHSWHPYLWIALIGFLLYAKTIWFGYTYLDDAVLVNENFYYLKNISNFKELFRKDVFLDLSYENAFYYRPLLNASFMLDAQFTATPSPEINHLANLIYHIIAGTLLYFFLLKMNYRREIVFLLSILFLVHPVLTQAVAWIPGRNDPLLAIFVLASFIQLMNFTSKIPTLQHSDIPSQFSNGKLEYWKVGKKSAYLFFHLIFFAMALFTKESAMVMPLIFIFYLFSQKVKLNRPIWILIIGWLVICLVWWEMKSQVLTYADKGYMQNIFSNFILNSPVILHYIGKIFFPFNLSVLPIIQDTSNIYGFIAIIMLAGIFIFFRSHIQNPAGILFGAVWFLLFLIPPLVIRVPFLTFFFFEHRLYVPMIGVMLLFSSLLNKEELLKKIGIVYLTGGVIGILFSFITYLYLPNFIDQFAFWKNAVQTSPHSAPAHLNMGNNYFFIQKYDSALKELNVAIQLNPNEFGVHNLKGVIYLNQNRLDKAKKEFMTELERHPNTSYETLENLSMVYRIEQQYDVALQYLQKAIQVNDRHASTYYYLGFCYWQLNQKKEAESAWIKSIELNPLHIDAHFYLIVYYSNEKRYREAKKYADAYIRLGGKLNQYLYNEIQNGNK